MTKKRKRPVTPAGGGANTTVKHRDNTKSSSKVSRNKRKHRANTKSFHNQSKKQPTSTRHVCKIEKSQVSGKDPKDSIHLNDNDVKLDANILVSNTTNNRTVKSSFAKAKKKKKLRQMKKAKLSAAQSVNESKTANERNDVMECTMFPRKPEDISSNWRQLQERLHIKPKKIIKLEKSLEEKHVETDAKTNTREPDIWFDDVDEVFIEASKRKQSVIDTPARSWNSDVNPLVKSHSYSGLTKVIAMDCEMVGTGVDGKDSILARVSIVNQYGQCIYDKYVKPTGKVTDYRTQFSGIRPGDMEKGQSFTTVQKEVYDILKGRILIGHAIHNDLKVLFLDHPRKAIRDTSKYRPFRKLFQGRIPSLKKLSDQILGVNVQEGEHNSVQDAQAAMRLYTMYRKNWEREIKLRTKLGQLKKQMTFANNKLSLQTEMDNQRNMENDIEN